MSILYHLNFPHIL